MESMGCQMNTADAERMEGQLQALGFQKADDPKDAQVRQPARQSWPHRSYESVTHEATTLLV